MWMLVLSSVWLVVLSAKDWLRTRSFVMAKVTCDESEVVGRSVWAKDSESVTTLRQSRQWWSKLMHSVIFNRIIDYSFTSLPVRMRCSHSFCLRFASHSTWCSRTLTQVREQSNRYIVEHVWTDSKVGEKRSKTTDDHPIHYGMPSSTRYTKSHSSLLHQPPATRVRSNIAM